MTSSALCYDFSLWYCLEDDAVAAAISGILREQGFHGYVEHRDQVAGQPLLPSVCEIIQTSRVAILLLTPRSVADAWCQRIAEWNLVHTIEQRGTKVIPVYVALGKEEVPLALRHLNGLCYEEKHFRHRLLASLQKSCRRTQRPSGGTNRGGF